MLYVFPTINFILLAFLLLLSGIIYISAFKFFPLMLPHLYNIKEQHFMLLAYVHQLLKYPRWPLIMVLIGNEVATIMISVVASSFFISHFGIEQQWITIAIMTPARFIFGEATPHKLAVNHLMHLSTFRFYLPTFLSFMPSLIKRREGMRR